MDRVKKMIHATDREVLPYTGEGVTVALLDTGMAQHPDLYGRAIAFRDFVSKRPGPFDDNGHGTHVAGCICGSGRLLNGRYRGIAPGSRLVVCRVLDEKGQGCVEDMIAGIAYVIRTQEKFGTRILNISVGVEKIGSPAAQEALLWWLEKAWRVGLLVLVAAGNNGPRAGSLSPMGYGSHVLAVGCHEGKNMPLREGCCESYSGRGPENNRLKKPDIVAPGTDIVSCSSTFGRPGQSGLRHGYVKKSGTSMAVPAVSGAAALLWQKYPDFSNKEIRERLLYAAQDLGEPWGKQGWGMLRVKEALFEG